MAEKYPKLGDTARAATALWIDAYTLLDAQPFDVAAATQLLPALRAMAEQARTAGLDKNWKELRKVSEALEMEIKRMKRLANQRGGNQP